MCKHHQKISGAVAKGVFLPHETEKNNFHVLQKPQTSCCMLTLLLLLYFNMQDCKHPTQNWSRGQTLKSPDRLWKCWGGKRKLPSHKNISVSETSVWYPSSFFHLGYRLVMLLWFFFFFFLPRSLTVCHVNQNLGMCERKRGERNLRGERRDGSNSSEPSDGRRWGGELPLKCRKTEMRFSLLLPLLLLLEAPGCTDLLEVWFMNHTWALKYRGVFMACSTGARIYLQQNSDHHNVPRLSLQRSHWVCHSVAFKMARWQFKKSRFVFMK